MKRRYFITQLLLGLSAGILAVACGSNDDPGPTISTVSGTEPIQAACSTTNPHITIYVNHGHILEIPIADVVAETGGTYTLTESDSSEPHVHTIVLSVADMQTLKANLSITVTTSFEEFHVHRVTITCIG